LTRSLAHHDVLRFRSAVALRLGLCFDDAKLGTLGEALGRRLEASGRAASDYLARLESHGERGEIAALARELTVGETYFFRNADQFHALRERVLPERLAARAGLSPVRILSAGCASGEEPYSVAMLVRDAGIEPTRVVIRAADLDPGALERARSGRFAPWALRETPPEAQQRWFKQADRGALLDESIRAAVQFDERNLAVDDSELWPIESYDVVFFRNVLMYFTPEAAIAALERVSRALVPGGYLFLGHAETLRGLSGDFHLRHTNETFYYQRRELLGRPAWDPAAGAAASAPSVEPLAEIAAVSDGWVDAIQRATERVRSLADAPRSTAVAGAREPTRAGVGHALELLRSERYGEALLLVDALPPALARDPEVLLLRAVLLTHGGALSHAEKACLELLAVDDLSAGAHYLLALCREGASDRAGALEHDRVAVYLDPGFAMPRLHLGLLARRRDDRDGARRELGQALILLRREDASRMLLFGGGFSRDALVALCHSELLACGGRP